jgi:hypothetical protein
MRKSSGLAWFLFMVCVSAPAQSGSPQPVPEHPTEQQKIAAESSPADELAKIDPAKAADIRRLMDVAGTKTLMTQVMETMQDSLKPVMARALPPGDYRDKLIDLFFVKFKSKADTQQLLDSIIPLYDKYLSDDEIKGLIQFYQTPLGQKTVTVMPKLVSESQAQGGKWGEALGRECMLEVLAEHPELEKAAEEAGKSTSQH